jgi:Conjugal transfer protein TraD
MWARVVARRERTRRLIEPGALVVKAKLDALTYDDRAVIYGALLTLAMVLQGKGADGQSWAVATAGEEDLVQMQKVALT